MDIPVISVARTYTVRVHLLATGHDGENRVERAALFSALHRGQDARGHGCNQMRNDGLRSSLRRGKFNGIKAC